jgi:hypothetical protein
MSMRRDGINTDDIDTGTIWCWYWCANCQRLQRFRLWRKYPKPHYAKCDKCGSERMTPDRGILNHMMPPENPS